MAGRRRDNPGSWRFDTLSGLACGARQLWGMQAQQARCELCAAVPGVFRAGVERYQQLADQVDALAGGVYRDPSFRPNSDVTLTPGAVTLLEDLRARGGALREEFAELAALSLSDQLAWWESLVAGDGYVALLQRLVGEFGDFEMLLPALPGTGAVIVGEAMQAALGEMYAIHTRHLRVMELLRWAIRRKVGGQRRDELFLTSSANLPRAVRDMIVEYMIRSDPHRIAAARQRARDRGRDYQPYRFCRSAENLRLLAKVDYVGLKRSPKSRRHYVTLDLDGEFAPLCVDHDRLAWAIREVFNNALTASSQMWHEGHAFHVKPLPRHDVPTPKPAIRIATDTVRMKVGGFRRRTYQRLRMIDHGVGIAPADLPHVTKWGYSPRREEFRKLGLSTQEIQIGGKGIGLSYAKATARELGGDLTVESTLGQGTTVTILLPSPTAVSIS